MRRLLPLLLLLAPAVASAHGGLLSQGEYRFEEGEVVARLVFSAQELATSVHALDADGDEDLTAAELETREFTDQVTEELLARITVTSTAGTCTPRLEGRRLVEGNGVELDVMWRCPPGTSEASVDAAFLEHWDDGHRHLVTLLGTTSSDVAIAVKGNHRFTVSGTPSAGNSRRGLVAFLLLGVQHILEGWDHLLFLFALVLVGGKFRSLLAVVTAFTVGHSLSLAVGTFGWWVPAPTMIEPLIALSIAWVGVENFFVDDASRRWRITLPFGFIHGFGFAGVLRELGLAQAEVPVALLGFNLGVEAGQIAVLAVLLPLVLWARNQAWFGAKGLHAVSGVVVAVGGALFVARVLGLA